MTLLLTKAAVLGNRFAAKVNGNFSGNPRRGLPAIQGAVVLCDAANGRPLAIMDSIEITIQRTGAATAVAAKYLAVRGGGRVRARGRPLTEAQARSPSGRGRRSRSRSKSG